MEGVLKTINTPIFTPIAFLHDDARRRSQSRSPPQSPLRLNNALALGDVASAEEPKGLGLVDELDTPAPGHMASTPTPLSATTTPTPSEPPSPVVSEKSLEQRFVKSTESKEPAVKVDGEDVKNEDAEVESMVLSEDPQ
jgi:serine/threonine-protein phosphatase 4 regulatory subunit 2